MNSRGVALLINFRGGQAKLSQQSTNPQKFLGSFRYRQSAKILGAHSAIANPHVFTKYCPTLSENSPKNRLFKTSIFYIFEYL
jgi:hypothetical protein